MDAAIVNILMFMLLPLIFFVVGVILIVKGIKGLAKGSMGSIKVEARCIQVDEIMEEGSMARLYRPVFQYEYQGAMLTASKIDYEYEKSAEVGDFRTITVEKKYPDVIVEPKDNASSVKSIILIVMGIMFAATIVEIGLPLLFALILQF